MNRRDFIALGAATAAASMVATPTAATAGTGTPAGILVVGDSWAQLSANPIRVVTGESVLDISIGGTTAKRWAEGEFGNVAQIAQQSGVHTVYLSLGALDFELFGTTDQDTAGYVASIVWPLTAAGVRVVHAGYNPPWFPRFQLLLCELAYYNTSYIPIDFTHMDDEVVAVDWGHLRTEDYYRRIEYAWSKL